MDCFHRFDFKKKIIPLILLKEQYRNHRVVGQKLGKDLLNSKFPKNRYFSNKILRISNRRNLKISNKATRQRDDKLYHTVPLYPIGIKRKPLSALFREIYISAFLLRPRIPPHFVQKRRQTRRVFPLIRGKLGKTREILRESLFQPLWTGGMCSGAMRNRVDRFLRLSSSPFSASSSSNLSSARLFVTGDGASKVWLFDSLPLFWRDEGSILRVSSLQEDGIGGMR